MARQRTIVYADDDDLELIRDKRGDKLAELGIKVAILCLTCMMLIFIGLLIYLMVN